jgi:membrane-bound lytic murein transglycosylase D
MNKLLLLATSLICLSMRGYSSEIPQQKSGAPYEVASATNDSTIKDAAPADPKGNFRDLFETDAQNGLVTARLNPKAVSFVQDYMESDGARLNKMKSWGKPFFDRISKIFQNEALPAELKYLAVIESDLKTSATSSVGAAGPWQFMSTTARELGLKVNRSVDERRDFNKSTKAAARYLSDLYDLYGDWLLVIAAYNGGPGNVNSAIRKSGSRNFWDLQYYLPAESRNHVKKFIATHYIMEGDAGLTTLTKHETEALMLATQAQVTDPSASVLTVTGKFNSLAITQQIQMSVADFNRLNPEFDRKLASSGAYDLRLPADKMSLFQANRQPILEQSIQMLIASATR